MPTKPAIKTNFEQIANIKMGVVKDEICTQAKYRPPTKNHISPPLPCYKSISENSFDCRFWRSTLNTGRRGSEAGWS